MQIGRVGSHSRRVNSVVRPAKSIKPMTDIQLTDLIQCAYNKAIDDIEKGKLPIRNIQDACHLAYSYALFDIYGDTKKASIELHYNKPIDELYELFDNNELSIENTYGSFSFCYLKVYLAENALTNRQFNVQFEHERKKNAPD